jgi:hypothetical protein
MSPGRARGRAVALVVAALALPGCAEVESETAKGYEPAKLQLAPGSEDVQSVTFTAEGARRTGLETASVEGRAGRSVVPYAALIYDAEGRTFVYTSPKARTYVRRAVTVDRIDAGRVFLTRGPAAGATVVTTGAAEVYGAELDIAASH